MASPSLITLENERIRVGIAPAFGGRVILLARPEGANVLKAHPSLVAGRPRPRHVVTPRSRFEQWNGHTVWLGPQSGWWLDQHVHPVKRKKRAVWPPDPYGEKGAFEIARLSPTAVTMVGPESPVSGAKLTKTVSIEETGVVRFEVTAVNVRTRPIAWGLWQNTRVDGYARCYVPVGRVPAPRITGKATALMPHATVRGYFTFEPAPPPTGVRAYWAKAFIYPSEGTIAAFTGGDLFLIRFDRFPAERIHPEQALVEMYSATTHEPDGALLELEYHAPYRTLEPGESMAAEERWEVRAYVGGHTPNEHLDFLAAALAGSP